MHPWEDCEREADEKKRKKEERREERELERRGGGGETEQKFSNWMNCQAPRVKLQLFHC